MENSMRLRSITNGNFNQFDGKIFESIISRGRQCTANAVVFLAFTKVINMWYSIDIDNVLIIGDFIYKLSARNENLLGKFLGAIHIVKNIHIPICGHIYDDCVIKCIPQMNRQWSGSFDAHGLEYLKRCLKQFENCVFTCGGISFGIHKGDCNSYYMFDSHGRDGAADLNFHKPAAVMVFEDVSSLHNCIKHPHISGKEFNLTPFIISTGSKNDVATKMEEVHKLQNLVEDIIPIAAKLPSKVKEREMIYMKYKDIDKSMYLNAPTVIENVRRRLKDIPEDAFPGATIVNGLPEFYVDQVLQEVNMKEGFAQNSQKLFIVIWCGWPDEYATIEPLQNVRDCVALTHFLLAGQGKLTGTSRGRIATAVRTTKINSFQTRKILEGETWFSMDIKSVFETEKANGNFDQLVGIIGTNRTEIFWKEYLFFMNVWNNIQLNPRRGYTLSNRIWGNYFGRNMRHSKIATSILCNNTNTFWRNIQDSWGKMEWNENNEKHLIFLIISQVGEFQENMNAVSTKSNFKTHAQLFIAKDNAISGRTYFCIDPKYCAPCEKDSPLEFLTKHRSLPFSNHITMYHGTQRETDDCFYRIFRYIDQIFYGKFDFNKTGKIYTVGTKCHKQ